MKHIKMKYGFTLIELLVVVIIIAVLSAVAVPQYKHAVLKSRFSTVMPVTKAVADAQEVYYLAYSEYATKQADLDIAVPPNAENTQVSISQEEKYNFVLSQHSKVPNAHYIMYQAHSTNFPGNIHCEAKADDTEANWLCEKGLRGTKIESGRSLTEGYITYILQGSESDGTFAKTYYNQSNLVLTDGDRCVATSDYGCSKTQASNGSICNSAGVFYGCKDSFFNHSTCMGSGVYSCYATSFTNDSLCDATGGHVACKGPFENSTCIGDSTGDCGNSVFTSSACISNEGEACRSSEFSNSTCTANGSGGCGRGTFSDNSICYAKVSEGFDRTCGGVKGQKNALYTNSTCYNQSTAMGACGAADYTEGSKCYGNEYGGCGGNSTFSGGSSCYAYSSGGCGSNTYSGGSICHANAPGACNDNTYNDTSYCSGAYCPAGSPAGNAEEEVFYEGKCWDGNGNYGTEYCN